MPYSCGLLFLHFLHIFCVSNIWSNFTQGKCHLWQLKQLLLALNVTCSTLSQTIKKKLFKDIYAMSFCQLYLSVHLSIYSIYLLYLSTVSSIYLSIMSLLQYTVRSVPHGPVSQRKHWPALQTPEYQSPKMDMSSSYLFLEQAIAMLFYTECTEACTTSLVDIQARSGLKFCSLRQAS